MTRKKKIPVCASIVSLCVNLPVHNNPWKELIQTDTPSFSFICSLYRTVFAQSLRLHNTIPVSRLSRFLPRSLDWFFSFFPSVIPSLFASTMAFFLCYTWTPRHLSLIKWKALGSHLEQVDKRRRFFFSFISFTLYSFLFPFPFLKIVYKVVS